MLARIPKQSSNLLFSSSDPYDEDPTFVNWGTKYMRLASENFCRDLSKFFMGPLE